MGDEIVDFDGNVIGQVTDDDAATYPIDHSSFGILGDVHAGGCFEKPADCPSEMGEYEEELSDKVDASGRPAGRMRRAKPKSAP